MAALPSMAERQITEIGRVVMYFSWLEFVVKLAILNLTNLSQKDWEAVTAPLSFRQSLDALSSLYKFRHPKGSVLEARFESLRTRAEECESSRNDVVHSAWIISRGTGKLQQFRITARGKTGLRENLAEGRDISGTDSLRAIADKIEQTSRDFSKFLGLSKTTTVHIENLADLER